MIKNISKMYEIENMMIMYMIIKIIFIFIIILFSVFVLKLKKYQSSFAFM